MKFRVEHLSGSKVGQEQVLEARILRVGRDPTCELAFDPYVDDQVSTHHAQIMLLDNGQLLLSDLKSRNGTFLDGQRVTAAVPLPNGAEVRFGDEGGPRIRVHLEPGAAAAPAAAAPAAKKGGKGACLIVGILAFVGLLCVGGGVVLAVLRSRAAHEAREAYEHEREAHEREAHEREAHERERAAREARAGAGDPAPRPAREPDPEPEPEPEPAARKNPWANFGVGTSFEMKSTTEMEVAGNVMTSEAVMKHTLVELTDDIARVSIETSVMGHVSSSEMEVPLTAQGEGEAQENPFEEAPATVEVPAGSFACTYRKQVVTQDGQETVTELWMSDDMPVAYKIVVTSPTMTSTTVLTAEERK